MSATMQDPFSVLMDIVGFGGQRSRGGRRSKTETYLNSVIEVLDGLREHWPLTLRQVYYQLVAAGLIDNNRNQYQKLSRVLSTARLDESVPWEAIEDRSRTVLQSDGWDTADDFHAQELDGFLARYRRDLLQGQQDRLEVWVEKDALSRVVHDVAVEYCVPVIVARGFSSMSFKNECRNRILANADREQQTTILYFGDMDPSGYEMLPTMMKTLRGDMGLMEYTEGRHIALTPAQVEEFDLPINPDALKDSDSRAQKYRERFGDLAVELDALRPDVLQDLVRRAIESQLDLDIFEAQRALEADDLANISALKQRVADLDLTL